MRYKRENPLLFDLQQLGVQVNLAGGERLYLGEIVGVGDDHRGGDGELLALNIVNIELQEQLSCFNAVAGFDLGGEALAVELDGVHADVDQQLRAGVGGDAEGVAGAAACSGSLKRINESTAETPMVITAAIPPKMTPCMGCPCRR